jgi:DNA-binding NarL/FixJ family response regulator
MKTKVAIVDDNPRIRTSLRDMMLMMEGVDCLMDCTGPEEALEKLPNSGVHVVLMDIQMPDMDGVACTRRLLQVDASPKVMMLTNHHDHDAILSSFKAGARGYLLKPIRGTQLMSAIDDVMSGGSPIASHAANHLVDLVGHSELEPETPSPVLRVLSRREREILSCLNQGWQYKEIANNLTISYSTVRTHVERLYKKLCVQSRAQALAKAGYSTRYTA